MGKPKKHAPVPWFTNEIRQAIARRKRAFRRHLRLNTVATRLDVCRERAIVRRLVRQAKREAWQSFISSFNKSTPLSSIWRGIRALKGGYTPTSLPILQIDDQTIGEPQAVLNAMASSIASVSNEDGYSHEFRNRLPNVDLLSINPGTSHDYNSPFTLTELAAAIKTSGNTAIGPDQLHYAFFRHLSQDNIGFLLSFYNKIWTSRVYPRQWKTSVVIPILKSGRPRQFPSSYRPISLTSCMGKLMERMVAKRLSHLIEAGNLLDPLQCGFRAKRSAIDHAVRLETDIRYGFAKKHCTLATFLDIRQAYDTVHPAALLEKLHRHGFSGNLLFFLKNFITGPRQFYVRMAHYTSRYFTATTGLPQGSVLSPILFNFMINDLFLDIPNDVHYSLYADDSAIWTSSADARWAFKTLQLALDRLSRWSRKNGLDFRAHKSATVLFSAHRHPTPATALTINGSDIPYVRSFKFLGLVLDNKINMNLHIEHLKTKCSRWAGAGPAQPCCGYN